MLVAITFAIKTNAILQANAWHNELSNETDVERMDVFLIEV